MNPGYCDHRSPDNLDRYMLLERRSAQATNLPFCDVGLESDRRFRENHR